MTATYKNYSTVVYVHIYRYILSACPCCVLFPYQSKGIIAAAPRRFLSWLFGSNNLAFYSRVGSREFA